MPTPRAVAQSLRRSATKISGVRREGVAEAAQLGIETAVAVGGTFIGGRYRLIAEVVSKKDTAKRSELLLYAKPAGLWSIKSYGRQESVGEPLLNTPQGPRPRSRATGGDGRWLKVADEVEESFGELIAERVEAALEE